MEQLQVMEKELNIQQMAQAHRAERSYLGYYERAGLMIEHVGRDEGNGHRSITPTWAWIEFSSAYRPQGCLFADNHRYTELVRQVSRPCPNVCNCSNSTKAGSRNT